MRLKNNKKKRLCCRKQKRLEILFIQRKKIFIKKKLATAENSLSQASAVAKW